jgi:hypothetical protein
VVVPDAVDVIDMDDKCFSPPLGEAALIALVSDKAFVQESRFHGVMVELDCDPIVPDATVPRLRFATLGMTGWACAFGHTPIIANIRS